jgi:hypothetical protein
MQLKAGLAKRRNTVSSQSNRKKNSATEQNQFSSLGSWSRIRSQTSGSDRYILSISMVSSPGYWYGLGWVSQWFHLQDIGMIWAEYLYGFMSRILVWVSLWFHLQDIGLSISMVSSPGYWFEYLYEFISRILVWVSLWFHLQDISLSISMVSCPGYWFEYLYGFICRILVWFGLSISMVSCPGYWYGLVWTCSLFKFPLSTTLTFSIHLSTSASC